jgi:hypothetical protein
MPALMLLLLLLPLLPKLDSRCCVGTPPLLL